MSLYPLEEKVIDLGPSKRDLKEPRLRQRVLAQRHQGHNRSTSSTLSTTTTVGNIVTSALASGAAGRAEGAAASSERPSRVEDAGHVNVRVFVRYDYDVQNLPTTCPAGPQRGAVFWRTVIDMDSGPVIEDRDVYQVAENMLTVPAGQPRNLKTELFYLTTTTTTMTSEQRRIVEYCCLRPEIQDGH